MKKIYNSGVNYHLIQIELHLRLVGGGGGWAVGWMGSDLANGLSSRPGAKFDVKNVVRFGRMF